MSSRREAAVTAELVERYRKSNYKFPLTEATQCLYCKQILVSAYQTDCGCRYCLKCLDEYQDKGNTKCLGADCEEIEGTTPDNAINKEIANMKVSCLFKSEGCNYEDSLKNMNKHLENCEYRPVACPKCQELVNKALLENHLQEKCPMRNVKCEHCQKSMPIKQLETTHLNADEDDLCDKFIGTCPNNCGEKNKVLLRDHLLVFKNQPMACPYFEFGCKKRFSCANANQHFIDENLNHTTSLIKHFKNEINALNVKYNTLSTEHESEKRDRDYLKKEVSKLQQVAVLRDGTLIWKIEKFSSLRQSSLNGDKLSRTSDPFYTREFGYKMRMKIYPGGDGVGKGTHLSVFFTLMKGDYDEILTWPFKNKVTLTILDRKHKTSDYSDTFKPDPKSTCYQQPVEEYNIASGSPRFVTFEQLNETLLKNDTIFLKIQILN